MKLCPKCNTPNRDEAKFCTTCGDNLVTQTLSTVTGSTAQDNYSAGAAPSGMPESQPATDYVYSGESQPPAAPPRKKTAVFIVIAALIVIAAAAFLAVRLLANSNDPFLKLMKGYAKLSEMKKITATTTIDFDSDYEGDDEDQKMVSRIINDLGIKLITAADTDNLVFQFAIELLYDGKKVVGLAAGLNNEEAYIDPNELFEEKFYVVMEDLVPQYPDYIHDLKIVKKAADEVKIKIDQKKISKIVRDSLDDNIRASGDKVVLTLDNEIVKDLITNFVEEISEDKKLLESVRQYGVDLLKRIIKEEDNFKVLKVGILEDLLEKFEDEDEFEDYYINEFSESIKSLTDSSGSGLNSIEGLDLDVDVTAEGLADLPVAEELEMTFSFDKSGAISKIEYSGAFDADGLEAEMHISTEIKSGAKFTEIYRDEAIDIVELIDDADMQIEVAEKVIDNLKETVLDNKKLSDLIDELTGLDPGDAMDYLKMMLLLQFGG